MEQRGKYIRYRYFNLMLRTVGGNSVTRKYVAAILPLIYERGTVM